MTAGRRLPGPSPCGSRVPRLLAREPGGRRPRRLPGILVPVNLIDEMLSLDLLSTQQHHEIAAWVRSARTPEAIMAMPPHLWRALEAASLAMNIDADLTRPPWLGADLA